MEERSHVKFLSISEQYQYSGWEQSGIDIDEEEEDGGAGGDEEEEEEEAEEVAFHRFSLL